MFVWLPDSPPMVELWAKISGSKLNAIIMAIRLSMRKSRCATVYKMISKVLRFDQTQPHCVVMRKDDEGTLGSVVGD